AQMSSVAVAAIAKRPAAFGGEGATIQAWPSQWTKSGSEDSARGPVCPTAHASSRASAVTALRRGNQVKSGPETTAHCDPSQCSIRIDAGSTANPTAQTSLVALALTPRSRLCDVGEGLGTIVQRTPSQCSVSVSNWLTV